VNIVRTVSDSVSSPPACGETAIQSTKSSPWATGSLTCRSTSSLLLSEISRARASYRAIVVSVPRIEIDSSPTDWTSSSRSYRLWISATSSFVEKSPTGIERLPEDDYLWRREDGDDRCLHAHQSERLERGIARSYSAYQFRASSERSIPNRPTVRLTTSSSTARSSYPVSASAAPETVAAVDESESSTTFVQPATTPFRR